MGHRTFLAVWFAFVGRTCLATLFGTPIGDSPFPLLARLFHWGMLLFGIFLPVIPFRIEAQKARQKMEFLLQ